MTTTRPRSSRPRRTTFRCSSCGAGAPGVGRSVHRLRGVEHPGRGAHGARHPGASGRRWRRPVRIAEVADQDAAPMPTGVRRARPGAGRWAGPRLGHPRRRRAGHRQVDAAAPDGRVDGRPRPTGALPHRRGVGAAGPGPGRAARRPGRPAVAGRRHGPARRARPPRRRRSRRVLVVDSIQTVHDPELASAPGAVGPGPRVRRSAWSPRPAPGGSPSCSSVTSPRTAASPGPGCSSTWSTPCCPSRATATTPCACCGRSSTASAARPSSACSRCPTPACSASTTRARCSWPTAAPARPARSWCPCSTAAVRCWSRCRPCWPRPPSPRPAGRVRASRAAGSACCSPCSPSGPGCRRRASTCGSPSPAGSGPPSRRPTSAVALAVVSAITDVPVPGDLVVCGEVGLAGELRQVGHLDRRLAEAARLGFRRVLVPTTAPEPPAGLPGHPGAAACGRPSPRSGSTGLLTCTSPGALDTEG